MEDTKIFKFKDQDIELDIIYSPEEKTLWLSAKQMADLFQKDRTTISRYLQKIIEKQVAKNAHCSVNFAHISGFDKREKYYNLDIVIEIANRVKSMRGLMLKTQLEEQLKKDKLKYIPDEIIIYDDGVNKHELNFSLTEETVWANQAKIAEIFETTQQNVSNHINNILEDNELDDSVHKDYLYTASDGKQYFVTFYNLDMILAIGYRIRSSRAISFRKCVSEIIKAHLKEKYQSKGPNCIICRNDFLEMKNDIKQIKSDVENEIVYYPGDELRGFIEVKRFLETAKREIILIDNYLGHRFDDVFKNLNVEKTIITNKKNKKIDTCESYTVIKINDIHDRYVLVDDVCYKFGSSLEQLGEKISSVEKVTDKLLITKIKSLKNNVVQKEVKIEGIKV